MICKIILDLIWSSQKIPDLIWSSQIRRGPLQIIINSSAEAAQCDRRIISGILVIFPEFFFSSEVDRLSTFVTFWTSSHVFITAAPNLWSDLFFWWDYFHQLHRRSVHPSQPSDLSSVPLVGPTCMSAPWRQSRQCRLWFLLLFRLMFSSIPTLDPLPTSYSKHWKPLWDHLRQSDHLWSSLITSDQAWPTWDHHSTSADSSPLGRLEIPGFMKIFSGIIHHQRLVFYHFLW